MSLRQHLFFVMLGSSMIVFSARSTDFNPTQDVDTKFCNETLQCSTHTLDTHDAVQCDGFYGCAESIISSDTITCHGAYSCFNSSLTSSAALFCYGHSACTNASSAISDGMVSCKGQYACSYAQQLTSRNDQINCGGYASCTHSNIVSTGQIVANGEMALINASIDSQDGVIAFSDTPGIDVIAKGYYSGSFANIYCRSDTQCTLNCDATGCFELDLYCFYGSDCKIAPQKCGDNRPMEASKVSKANGVHCPNVHESTSLQEDEILLDYMEKRRDERMTAMEEWLDSNNEYQREENYRMAMMEKIHTIRDEETRRYYNNMDGIISVSVVLIMVFIAFCAYHTVNVHTNQFVNKRPIARFK